MSEAGIKAVFAAMALGSVLAGLGVYLIGARLGIDEDTVRVVSSAFLLLGIADTIVLYAWDRLFTRRR